MRLSYLTTSMIVKSKMQATDVFFRAIPRVGESPTRNGHTDRGECRGYVLPWGYGRAFGCESTILVLATGPPIPPSQ